MSMPAHGTEVFMGNLHRGATEAQLRDFASEAGEVFSVKLTHDLEAPSQNRGFGFVLYQDRAGALTAMDRLAGREMPDFPGHKVRVAPSQAKNRIFMGGLAHSMTQEELRQAIEEPLGLRGLLTVELAASREAPGTNRGFAFLEFHNAACAAAARKRLQDPDLRLAGRAVHVDYAEPAGRDAPVAQAIRTVFVGNLPAAATEESLKAAFEGYGEVEKVNIPKPKEGSEGRRFGFVHFVERLAAARAVEDAVKPEIEGVQLAVKYGKVQADPQQQQQQQGGGVMGSGGYGAGGRGGYGAGRGRGGFAGGGRGGYGGRFDNPQQQQQQYPQQQQQQQPQQQQQYHQPPGMQQAFAPGMMPGGYGGMGMAGGGMMMGGMGGGMVPVMPVQLPNGQMGFMMQPAMMGGALMGGVEDGSGGIGGPMRSGGRGAWRGGGGGGGYGGGGYGRGGDGGGRGGRGGPPRYQPY